MVTSGAVLLVTSPFQPFTGPAFGLYALATGIEAVRVGRKAGILAIPVVWAIFPVLHASHGVGFAAGVLRYVRAPDWSSSEETTRLAVRGATNGAHTSSGTARLRMA